jgi:predicted type IV restriction endonuclease
MSLPNKVQQRLHKGIKRFQPIVAAAKARDASEADTVTIVTDMLAEVFGYDKYSELTAELAIRGTYCDLATKIDGKVQSLVEVKAIGSELKDAHVKQAIDYAANQGVEWVMLTSGAVWRIYKVGFGKPITQELIVEVDVSALTSLSDEQMDMLYLFCIEGWRKTALEEYHAQKEALSRFFIGAMLVSETILDVIRRELRRMSRDVKIDAESIKAVLINEVIRRDVLEGEKAEDARKRVAKAANKSLRKAAPKSEAEVTPVVDVTAVSTAAPAATA